MIVKPLILNMKFVDIALMATVILTLNRRFFKIKIKINKVASSLRH